jgi:hypothetical protein
VLAGLTVLEARGLAVGVHGRYRPAGGLMLADPRALRQRPKRRRRLPDDHRPVCPSVRPVLPLPSARHPQGGPPTTLAAPPSTSWSHLLRQANAALLAAPNRFAASIAAAMRRSTHARVSIALGTP